MSPGCCSGGVRLSNTVQLIAHLLLHIAGEARNIAGQHDANDQVGAAQDWKTWITLATSGPAFSAHQDLKGPSPQPPSCIPNVDGSDLLALSKDEIAQAGGDPNVPLFDTPDLVLAAKVKFWTSIWRRHPFGDGDAAIHRIKEDAATQASQ